MIICIPNVSQSPQNIAGPEAPQGHGLHDRPSNVKLDTLPEQFFDAQISLASVCPETALMYAVLKDALLCLQEKLVAGMSHGLRRRAQEAEKWFSAMISIRPTLLSPSVTASALTRQTYGRSLST